MTDAQQLFEQDLRTLAQVDKALEGQEEYIQSQIDEIMEQQRVQLHRLRENLATAKQLRQEQEDKVKAKVNEYLDTAKDAKQEKVMRKDLHHLIKVKNKTTYDYDADTAREYVIEHKMNKFFNKPTLSKSKVQAAIKSHDADWLDYTVVQGRSVNIGKLGELIIIMESEAAKKEDVSE